MKIDLNVMKENNLELYTPLVVLNHEEHLLKDVHESNEIHVGDKRIELTN